MEDKSQNFPLASKIWFFQWTLSIWKVSKGTDNGRPTGHGNNPSCQCSRKFPKSATVDDKEHSVYKVHPIGCQYLLLGRTTKVFSLIKYLPTATTKKTEERKESGDVFSETTVSDAAYLRNLRSRAAEKEHPQNFKWMNELQN